jgi:general transcription factor 3C polypeptide 3 (transcription factor C subunit 4)
MVKHDPESANNFTLLQDFYPLIIETKQYPFGSSVYRTAFDYHLETFPGPPQIQDDEDEDEEEDEGNTMTLEHVMSLVDVLSLTEKLEEAVEVVRKGQRWLQGRGDQRYWDTFDDDREYAPDGAGEGHELAIGLRHRLALLRLRLGNDEEAFVSPPSYDVELIIGPYRRDTSAGCGRAPRDVCGIGTGIDEAGIMGKGPRLLCVYQRGRCGEFFFL